MEVLARRVPDLRLQNRRGQLVRRLVLDGTGLAVGMGRRLRHRLRLNLFSV
jgi:hypothetical protein